MDIIDQLKTLDNDPYYMIESFKEYYEDAMDFDETMTIQGEETELPQSIQNDILASRISGAFMQFFAEDLQNSPVIEKTIRDYGSGDAGRNPSVRLILQDDSNEELAEKIAETIHSFMQEFEFPYAYEIGYRYDIEEIDEGDVGDQLEIIIEYGEEKSPQAFTPGGEVLYRT